MGTRHQILIIDDDQGMRACLSDLLALNGFDVLVAHNGANGLELATEHQPDLILCDVSMPNMSGFEVAKALQLSERTAATPLIFLTARVSSFDSEYGLAVGAKAYLCKPFRSKELLTLVRNFLPRPRLPT